MLKSSNVQWVLLLLIQSTTLSSTPPSPRSLVQRMWLLWTKSTALLSTPCPPHPQPQATVRLKYIEYGFGYIIYQDPRIPHIQGGYIFCSGCGCYQARPSAISMIFYRFSEKSGSLGFEKDAFFFSSFAAPLIENWHLSDLPFPSCDTCSHASRQDVKDDDGQSPRAPGASDARLRRFRDGVVSQN